MKSRHSEDSNKSSDEPTLNYDHKPFGLMLANRSSGFDIQLLQAVARQLLEAIWLLERAASEALNNTRKHKNRQGTIIN
jgi:hypothetical protein